MKGESSDEVAAGCVLFAARDLNLLKVGEESDAIYGCAGPKAPLRITSNILSKWHGLGQVSWLKAGGDATAVMYDGEFAGNELTFNDESEDHSLVNKRFAKGSTANDNVKTILVTSEGAALSKLSEECESHLA
jgi:wobble nucleotide-excising tRNase